jgi:hypothetical protein
MSDLAINQKVLIRKADTKDKSDSIGEETATETKNNGLDSFLELAHQGGYQSVSLYD